MTGTTTRQFLLLFVFLSPFYLVTSLSVSIVPYGFVRVKAVGETAVFTCFVREPLDREDVTITWLDTAGQTVHQSVIDDQPKRVFTKGDVTDSLALHITNLEERDAGVYTCSVTQAGRYYRRSVTLNIYKPIEYVNCPESQTLYRGMEGVIKCSVIAAPSPIVSWTSKGRILATDERTKVTAEGLKIFDVQDEDTGTYNCMATVVSLGNFEIRTINVRVIEPPAYEVEAPHILHVHVNSSNTYHDSVTVTCVVIGKPAPDIQWFKYDHSGDQLLTGNQRSSVNQTKDRYTTTGVLHITELSTDDAGTYLCSAANEAGNTKQNFNLTFEELEEDKAPNIDRIHVNRTQDPNDDIMISCVASGFPAPTMGFYKRFQGMEEELIWSGGRYAIEESRTEQVTRITLVIYAATLHDQGEYICSASNRKASVRQSFEMNILDTALVDMTEPHISRVHVNRTGNSSEDITVTCVAVGIPSPQISFTRQTSTGMYQLFQPIDRMEVKQTESENQTIVSLTLSNSMPSDSGSYQCVAANIAGSVKQAFDVYAKDWHPTKASLPHVYSLHVNRTGKNGEDLMVTCLALSNPAAEMSWLRGGKFVFPDERRSIHQIYGEEESVLVLVIHNTTQDDSGNYTCTAKNIAGTNQQNFTLDSEGQGTLQSLFNSEDYSLDESYGTEWSSYSYNRGGQQRGSQWNSQTETGNDLPGPPSLVQISSDSATQATIRITQPHQSAGIKQFHVKYSFGGYDAEEKYVDFEEDSGGFTEVQLENLLPATTYKIHVSSVSAAGESRPTVLSYTTAQQRVNPYASQGQLGTSQDLEWLRKSKKTPQSAPFRLAVELVEGNARAVWVSWDWVVYVRPADFVQGFQILYTTDRNLPFESWGTVEAVGDTSRSYIVQGLTPGVDYYFVVRGRNSYGLGPYSDYFVYRIPLVPEIPPKNFFVESIRKKPLDVGFSWIPLDKSTAGTDVTEYRIYYSDEADKPLSEWERQDVSGDQNSYTLAGLESGTTYYFKIQARNSVGGSPTSSSIVYRTPTVRIPDPPSHVDVVRSTDRAVSLQIGRPVNSGGYPIDGYVLEYEPAEGRHNPSRQLLDTDGSYFVQANLTQLTPSTTYVSRVSARSRMGYSRPLEFKFTTRKPWVPTYGKQAGQTSIAEDKKWLKKTTGGLSRTSSLLKPRDVSVGEYSSETHALTLSWQRPLLPTIRVKGYRILWASDKPDAEPLALDVPGTQTSVNIKDLLPNTAYRFQVRTLASGNRKSPYTIPILFKTPALPDPPSDIRVDAGESSSVSVRIGRPRSLSGNPLTGYRIRYFAADEEGRTTYEEIISEPSSDSAYTNVEVKDLLPGIKYKFEVSSKTQTGFSSPRSIEFITPVRFQYQGEVAVEQETTGSQQSQQSQDVDLEWLRERQREQLQEQVTSEPPVTDLPVGDDPTASYTFDWDEYHGNIAGLVKYIVTLREVEVDPVTDEIIKVVSRDIVSEVEPSAHSIQLDRLKRNRYYQMEVTAVTRLGLSSLRYKIKTFVYWVPPETLTPPHIVHIHQNNTSPESDDIMISCEVTGSPVPHVMWMRKDGDEYHTIQTGDGINVQERRFDDKSVVAIIFRPVTEDSYGVYLCSANSPAGNTSYEFHFQEVVPIEDPQPPHIYRIHVNRTGDNEENIMGICKASGRPAPEMKWLRNEETLFPDADGRLEINSEKGEQDSWITLVINYPVSGDAGVYHCAAVNTYGSTTQEFTIETKYSPENLVEPHIDRVHVNRTGDENKDILMICQSSGSPSPEMRWSRMNDEGTFDIIWPGDGHIITQDQQIDSTENSLLIKQATEEDYGTYRCTAVNFADTVHQNVDVSFVRPENVEAPEITGLSIHQLQDDDNDILVVCTARGFPAPEISLLKKNAEGMFEILFPDERMTVEQDKGQEATTFALTIDEPAESDSGSYACSAVNIGGRVQQQFKINTQDLVAPIVLRINTKAPETKGGDVFITCVASGTPSPDVRWKAFGKTIKTNDRYIVTQEKGIGETVTKLTIKGGGVKDAHPYSCVAVNAVGGDKREYDLAISDVIVSENIRPPHIDRIHLNSTGPNDVNAVITCVSNAYPTASMAFYKKNRKGAFDKLMSTDSMSIRSFEEDEDSGIQLVISQASEKDAGVYRCAAENVGGAVTQDIRANLPVKVLENAQLPHISRIHINRTGLVRSDVTVTCVARGYPAPEMKWLRFDELVLPRGRFSIQQTKGENQTVISLTILQAVPEDEGSYQCSAVNIAGNVAQLFSIQLKEAQVKDPPHISRIHVNRTGLAEENLQVICTASGRPEMSFWKKIGNDFELVLPFENIDVVDEKTKERTVITMVIYEPRPEQFGLYQCMARNPAGVAEQLFTINTQDDVIPPDAGRPHVERIHVNRTNTGDRDVTVTCRVTGTPPPATNWLRRDDSGDFSFIWSSERYSVYEYRDNQGTTLTLTISDATPADDGVFLCSASNVLGDTQQQFALSIFAKRPEKLTPPGVQWIHVSREGTDHEDVVVTCTGVGEPAPEVGLWRRSEEHGEDYLVQIGDRVSVNYTKGASETTLNVRFAKATDADEGTYVCSASNMAGSFKQAFMLHVISTLPEKRVAPHISRVHINTTEEGDTMVTCIADGIPRPLMDWLRPNDEGVPKSMEIKNYHLVEEGLTGNEKTFVLIIQQPTQVDHGDYYCSARNLAGRVIQKFSIGADEIPKENLRRPHVTHVHVNMTGDKAADMMLTCVVTGTPAPLLSWWKSYGSGEFKMLWPSERLVIERHETQDGSILTLVIPNATPDDDGLYRCSAVSVAGSAGQVTKAQIPAGPPPNLESPTIKHIHVNGTGSPGEHLMITCQATGSPGPEMRWLRQGVDGQFFNVGAHSEDVTVDQYKAEDRSTLVMEVQSASPDDWNGVYRCHAINYAGSAQQDFDLTVQASPPTDILAPFIDRIHVNKSESNLDDVMITCRARGIPAPHMNILMMDEEDGTYYFIKPSRAENAILVEENDATSFSMIITNPPNGGRGRYRCQANNIAGAVRQDFEYNTIVIGAQSEEAPHVSRIHVDRAGETNQDLTVYCKASGKPSPQMNWWKYDGGEFKIVWPNDRVIIEQEEDDKGSKLTLLLKDATSDDDGEYLCTAANYVATAKQNFDFKVFESPPEDLVAAHVRHLHFNRTGPYQKGIMLTCLGAGNPSPEMRWYKQSDTGVNRLVLPSDEAIIEQVEEEDGTVLSLSIAQPKITDAGLYTCEASNVGGTVSYNVPVTLSDQPVVGKIPPHIAWIMVNRTGVNEEDISIYCVANGYPAPDIKWMKGASTDGRQVDYHYIWPVGRVQVAEDKRYNQTTVHMLIKSPESEDAGNYLCVATNIAGEAQQDFDVHTKVPTIINPETPHIEWIHMNRTGLQGKDMSITCVASGIPPPEIWFYKGDPTQSTALITPSERASFYQIQGTAKTILKLTLKDIQDEEAGPYLCKAVNRAGYRSQLFDVTVTEPEVADQRLPHVSHIRIQRTGISNQNVLLACEAEGNPAPELNWWKNEGTADTPQYRLLWPGDHYEIQQTKEAEKTTLNLIIQNVDESSLDTYLCSAANIGGEVRQAFDLTALPSGIDEEGEPRVDQLVVTRTEENELKLTCSADGLPPPDLHIYKLDETGAYQLLQPRDRIQFFETNGAHSTHLVVTIGQATDGDDGSYLCAASNRLGAARETADYTVQDAPYDDEVPPHISHIHVNRTVDNSPDVMITCIAEGSPAPTVRWWKDYSQRGGQDFKLLPPVGTHRIHQQKFSDHTIATLVLPRASSTEEGWYRCSAANAWGEMKQEFEVEVQVDIPRSSSPHIGIINVNKSGANKQDLTLTCVARGEPAPGMRLFKQTDDGNFYLVVPDSEEDISERRGIEETTLELVIRDYTLDDFGLYRCAAFNIRGRVSQTFNVRIEDTPEEEQQRAFITRIFVDRSADRETDVTLTCVANGVPAPEMSWQRIDRSGTLVSWPDSRFQTEQLQFEDYTVMVLTIRDATYADDGSFVCDAANILDQAQQQFSLRVFAETPKGLVAPKVSAVFANQSGADVSIYCIATGKPAPDLYLSKQDSSGNYVAVQPSASLEFSQKKKRQRTVLRLSIKDASEVNAGDYVCTASSLIGTSKRKFDFDVKAIIPVEIQGRPSVRRVLVQEPKVDNNVLSIKCFGQGDPLPKMMLFKRDARSGLDQQIKAGGRYQTREVEFPDSILLEVNVTDAKKTDSGVYICRAVNSKGTYRTKFNLTVETYTVSRKGAPEFMEPRVERTGSNGEDVQVTCRARGDPAPDLLFLRQTQEGSETKYEAITTGGRYSVSEKTDTIKSELVVTIAKATPSDAGNYLCSARNNRGSSRQSFKLSIQDSNLLPSKPRNVRTRSSQTTIIVTWSPAVTGVPPDSYKIGYGMVEMPDLFRKAVPADRLSYVIADLNPDTEFLVSVRALNKYGESPPVYVTEKTKSKLPPIGLEGKPFSSSEIILRWYNLDGDGIARQYNVRYSKVNERPRQYSFLNTTETSIRIAGLQTGEMYEFSVRTLLDGKKSLWSLSAQVNTSNKSLIPDDTEQVINGGQQQEELAPPQIGRPKFGGVQVLRSGENDADVTITCQSDGDPPPKIEFYKEDRPGQFRQILTGDRYILYPSRVGEGSALQVIIRNAKPRDAGNYMCSSQNTHGSIQQRFTLTIEEKEVQQGQEPTEEDIEWLRQQQQQQQGQRPVTSTVPPTVPARIPEFLDVKVQRTGESGADVTVVCEAQGIPAPSLEVLKFTTTASGSEYSPVQTGDRYTVTRETSTGGTKLTLVITGADATSDAGAYLCVARNTYGSARQQFRLNIREAEISREQRPGQTGQGSPRFEDVKVDRTGSNKQDVVVTCRLSGSPEAELNLWREVTVDGRKDYQIIKSGGRYSVNVQKHNGYSILRAVISAATSEDAGAYVCGAVSDAGTTRQQFSLTIEGPAPTEGSGAPKFEDVKVDRIGRNRADVVITCRVSGIPAPDLNLWREGEPASFRGIQSGGRYVVSQTKHGSETTLRAIIREATSADAGTYYCSAQNPKGSLRQQFSLTIDVAPPARPEGYPEFEDVKMDRTGISRGDIVFTCKANGSPAPDIYLWREITAEDGTKFEIVRTGGRFVVDKKKYGDYSILRAVIRSMTAADTGLYLCSAQNTVGSSRQQFDITLTSDTDQQSEGQSQVEVVPPGRPAGYPEFEDVKVDRSGVNNANVVVTCRVGGSPAPDLHLWKEVEVDGQADYQRLQNAGRLAIIRNKYHDYSLLRAEIQSATSEDAGTYLCSATNSHGTLRQQFKLTIGEVEKLSAGTPQIGDVIVEPTGRDNKDVKVTCSARGSPTPVVTIWRKQQSDYELVEESSRIRVDSHQEGDEGSVSVLINQVTAEDAGAYLCTAINAKGTIKQQFNLTVQVGSASGTDDSLRIQGVTVDSTGENNEDVSITCSGIGSPAPNMRLWRYQTDGYQIVQRTSRISVDQRRGVRESVLTVVIQQSTQEDAGIYICSATNADGTVRQQFNLTIQEYSTPSKDLPKMSDVTVERTGPANENALITCSVTGNPAPDVKLYKKNEEGAENEYQHLQSGDRLVLNETPEVSGTVLTLLVKDVGPQDSGTYMCEASNTGGTVRQSFRWGIEAAQSDSPDLPQITSLTADPYNPHDGHVTLRCSASSVSEPEMKWWKLTSNEIATEYEIIFPGERLLISEKTDAINTTLTLIIQNAGPADAGKYLCTAQNQAGSDQKTIQIKLKGEREDEMSPRIIRKSEDISLKEGGQVDLACVANGNPPPAIKWWRYDSRKSTDFHLIWPNGRFTIVKKVKDGQSISSLTIRDLGMTDAGLYVCTAVNKHGSVRRNVTVQVKTSGPDAIPKPRIVKHPTDRRVENGQPAKLECLAEGVPQPTITWYKNGRRVLSRSRVIQLKKGSLFFSRVSRGPADEGVYYCRATNIHGSVFSRNATLEVKVSHEDISATPDIIRIEQTESGEDTMTLKCEASGKPAPDMKWWKTAERTGATEYHQLSAGGRMNISESKQKHRSVLVLTIKNPSFEDSGKYLCIASNRVGKRRRAITVLVRDTPLTNTAEKVPSGDPFPTDSTTPSGSGADMGVSTIPGQLPEILTLGKEVINPSGVKLVCAATGYPTPKMDWWKYDTSVTSPLYHLITSEEGKDVFLQYINGTSRLTLTIKEVTSEVLGTYQCTATNYVGQARRSFHLSKPSDNKDDPPPSTSEPPVTTVSETPNSLTTNPPNTTSWNPISTHTSWPTSDTTSPTTGERPRNKSTLVNTTTSITGQTTTRATVFQTTMPDVSPHNCQEVGRNIKIKPSTHVEAKLGRGLVMTCDFAGYSPVYTPILSWYSPGGKRVVETNTTHRVYVSADGHYRQLLFIDTVGHEDSGQWTCLSLVDGQIRCGKVTVLVFKDITFRDLPRSVNGLSGQDILLACHVDGFPRPEMSWSRDGKHLAPHDPYIYTHRGLLIHELKKADAGKYLCEARVPSTGRYKSRLVSLYVDGELPGDRQVGDTTGTEAEVSTLSPCTADTRIRVPILFILPSVGDLTAYSGQGVVLTCQTRVLSSCDSVKLVWRDPMSNVVETTDTTQRKFVRKSENSLELILKEISPQDAGTWRCSGATVNTEVSKSVILKIMDDIHLSEPSRFKYSTRPHHDVFLECNVRGSPTPVVTWAREGTPVILDHHYQQDWSGLRVKNVTSVDAGSYTCQAYVPETGSFHSWNFELSILAPPKVTIEISNTRVGSFSALICTGKGTPAPQLTWYKDDLPINQDDERIKLEGLEEERISSKSVIFIPLDETDEGNYSCVATSEGGVTEQSYLLEPLSRPGLPGSIKEVQVSPNSVTLAISPPEEDNKSPILDYHIAYISMRNFEQTRKTVEANGDDDVLVRLEDLTPQTTYRVRIYARNIVDFGSFRELYVTTSE